METYQRPSYRSCLVGVIAGGVIYIAVWLSVLASPAIATQLGNIVLYIPLKSGLVQEVTAEDVIKVTYPVETHFELPDKGSYLIFATDLLPAEDRVVIREQGTGKIIKVPYILQGTNYLGEAVVVGKPVFEFEVERGGAYKLHLQKLPVNAKPEYTLFIVPNATARNRGILLISLVVYIGIFTLTGWGYYYWRNKEQIQQTEQEKEKKRAKFEEWIKEQKSTTTGF
ncbi:MAG: hypothetical protein GXP41_01485 [Chloroflexi bacterium]|nr:hypothetical protein [Chloroflexota bacterium]